MNPELKDAAHQAADHFRPDWVRAERRGTLSAALYARLDQEMQARFDVRRAANQPQPEQRR